MAGPFNLDSYRFRGVGAEGRGTSLIAAIHDLADFWDSRHSLVMHAWGVLNLRMTIAGREAVFEIADPAILDALERGDNGPLISLIAKDMGLEREQAEQILGESSEVVATVDRVRSRQRPNAWEPSPGLSTQEVLTDASGDWVRNLSKEIDREIRRGKGRPRSLRGKAIVRMAVDLGRRRDMSNAELSRMTGIPRGTLRDTKVRMSREKKIVAGFQERKRGERLTSDQERVIMASVVRSGNAAKTARDLGLPPRTVRDVRARAQRAARGPSRQSKDTQAKLVGIVRSEGISATEAGRRLGIPARTARGWVYKAKWGK